MRHDWHLALRQCPGTNQECPLPCRARHCTNPVQETMFAPKSLGSKQTRQTKAGRKGSNTCAEGHTHIHTHTQTPIAGESVARSNAISSLASRLKLLNKIAYDTSTRRLHRRRSLWLLSLVRLKCAERTDHKSLKYAPPPCPSSAEPVSSRMHRAPEMLWAGLGTIKLRNWLLTSCLPCCQALALRTNMTRVLHTQVKSEGHTGLGRAGTVPCVGLCLIPLPLLSHCRARHWPCAGLQAGAQAGGVGGHFPSWLSSDKSSAE